MIHHSDGSMRRESNSMMNLSSNIATSICVFCIIGSALSNLRRMLSSIVSVLVD
jgi:hypothetical protein